MRLARFTESGTTRIGRVVEDRVHDLSSLVASASMREFLTRLDELKSAVLNGSFPSFELTEVRLEAPIADPQKVLAIGMNYQAHALEAIAAGVKIPEYQFWFNKQVSCLNGPYDAVEYPAVSDQLDYEAELVVVIGRRCKDVKRENARSVIAGYTVGNDISARDWQHRTTTFTLGKSFDTHGPIGPFIITDDEVSDPHQLLLHLSVNGEERQRTSTGDMIYDIFDQITYLSTVMTLEPGDLLFTGTPSGVGAATGNLLKVGDVVRVEVDGIGVIENRIVQGESGS
jgi:2-keto-4-pentenoate hydratase/2-oxohepta-3-ene-1,7-dioic acid hydratase in catechol pathway